MRDDDGMDVIQELTALRDATRKSIERLAGLEMDAPTTEEIEKRKKLIADIEADIRRLGGANANRT